MMRNSSILESKTKVKISEILSPAISVGISTVSNITKFAEMARETPQLLPTIKIGKIDDKLYAINHHDAILGCRQAGPSVISEINAVIIDGCNGSTDIFQRHFIEILENESLNSAAIWDSIYFMEEKLQLKKPEILKILHISGTPFEKIILSKSIDFISARSIEQLQLIVEQLSQRKNLIPSQICVPLYVISKISRLEKESHQLQLISQIHADLDAMSDGTFAWTTPEQIRSMIKYIKQDATHEENNREESTTAVPTKTEDVGGRKEEETTPKRSGKKKNTKQEEQQTSTKDNPRQNQDDDDENPDKSQAEKLDPETLTVKKSIPNMIIIIDEKTGKPQMLVNKRTGAVSKIIPTDNHSIIKIDSVGTKPLYSIPMDVIKHLRFDESHVRHKNFDTPRQLIDALGTFPKDAPLSVFWSVA